MSAVDDIFAGRSIRSVVEAGDQDPILSRSAGDDEPTGLEPAVLKDGWSKDEHGRWTTYVLARRPNKYIRAKVFPPNSGRGHAAYVELVSVMPDVEDGVWRNVADRHGSFTGVGRSPNVVNTLKRLFRRLLHLPLEWPLEFRWRDGEELEALKAAYQAVLTANYDMEEPHIRGYLSLLFRPKGHQ